MSTQADGRIYIARTVFVRYFVDDISLRILPVADADEYGFLAAIIFAFKIKGFTLAVFI